MYAQAAFLIHSHMAPSIFIILISMTLLVTICGKSKFL